MLGNEFGMNYNKIGALFTEENNHTEGKEGDSWGKKLTYTY